MTERSNRKAAAFEKERAHAAICRFEETIKVEPDAEKFATILDSTGWSAPAEPVALSGFFLAHAVYPRLARVCTDLGAIPVHETQAIRFVRVRPDGAIAVTARYQCIGQEQLRVDVRLASADGVTWAEGALSFRLFYQPPEKQP